MGAISGPVQVSIWYHILHTAPLLCTAYTYFSKYYVSSNKLLLLRFWIFNFRSVSVQFCDKKHGFSWKSSTNPTAVTANNTLLAQHCVWLATATRQLHSLIGRIHGAIRNLSEWSHVYTTGNRRCIALIAPCICAIMIQWLWADRHESRDGIHSTVSSTPVPEPPNWTCQFSFTHAGWAAAGTAETVEWMLSRDSRCRLASDAWRSWFWQRCLRWSFASGK